MASRKQSEETTNPEAFQTVSPAPDSLCAAPVGDFQDGRYRVLSEVGSGSYGIVFKANDRQLGRVVAIKLSKGSIPCGSDNLLHEARMAAALKHPGIVPIYDIASLADGRSFIVSQFIEGGNLQELLSKRGSFSVAETCRIGAAIARSLHHIHQSGFIHRDLKPANILLDHAEQPIIADLGLALSDVSQHTSSGQFAGTLAYMAPEQCSGKSEHLDGRADLWALGAIMYEMLVGRRPFIAATTSALMDEILLREPKPLRMQNDQLPSKMIEIVNQCLEKDPRDRFDCGNDLADALDHVASTENITATPTGQHLLAKKSTVLLASLLAGLTVLTSAGLYWTNGNSQPTVPTTNAAPEVPRLQLQSFDIYISPQRSSTEEVMLSLGRDTFNASEHDGSKIIVSFNRPAYFYLLALNPDSSITLCHPFADGSKDDHYLAPKQEASIRFPASPVYFYKFTDGPGNQVFLLLASENPLPTFSDWNARHPDFQWSPPTKPIFHRPLLVNGQTMGSITPSRGTAEFAEFIERLESYPDIQIVEMWAFPIQSPATK